MILTNKENFEANEQTNIIVNSDCNYDWRFLNVISKKMKNIIDNVEVIDETAVNEESNKRYLFFDIESATGSKGCICEFGYVVTNENLEIIEERNVLMNPKCEFSWRVLRKILKKDKRVYESQKGFTSHYDFIKKLITTSDLVFGFATVNDVIYLNDDCDRFNKKAIDYKFYDIQKILGEFDSSLKNLSLENEMISLGIEFKGNLHDAKDDALNSMLVLKRMKENLNISLNEILDIVPNLVDINKDGEVESVTLNRMIRLENANENKSKRKKTNKKVLAELKKYIEMKKIEASNCIDDTNPLFGKKICLSRNFESHKIKGIFNIINELAAVGAVYDMKASQVDIFVIDEDENDIRMNGIRHAQENGKDIKIINLEEFLKVLNLSIEELETLDYPQDYLVERHKNETTYFGNLLLDFYKEEKTCLI